MATVAVIFAVLGFMRGIVRFVFSILGLGAGFYAGHWGYYNGDPIVSKVIKNPDPFYADHLPLIFAVILGLGVFSISRNILGFMTGSFNETSAAKKVGFGAPAGIFGLLSGLVFAGLGMSGVKHAASVAELHHLNDHISGESTDEEPPLLVQLKQTINASKPGQWHEKIDPFNDTARLNLAKLFVVRKSTYHSARASASSDAGAVLGQPDITQLLVTGKKPYHLAKDERFFRLLNSMELKKVSSIPSAEKALLGADINASVGLKYSN